jgi:flagellar FliL protein
LLNCPQGIADDPHVRGFRRAGSGERRAVKKILLFGTIGLLLLGGGGAGAWWWFSRGAAAQAAAPADAGKEKAEAEHADLSDSGVLPLDPFLVNLADAEAPRFLRASLSLVIADRKHALHLSEDVVAKARIRSAVLELLATQKSSDLVTPDGKSALKKSIVTSSAAIVTEAKVVDVLFSEFVVQF